MGMFDTVYHTDKKGNEIEIQFKTDKCILSAYTLGDSLEETPDGIYFGHNSEEDGCFVVFDSKIVAIFSNKENYLKNKWGGIITKPDINDSLNLE